MQCTFDVIAEIAQRPANRIFHALESGKMDDGLDWIFAEQPFDCRWVSKIAVLEGDRPATNRFHASEGFNVAVNKVVEYDNGVSGIQGDLNRSTQHFVLKGKDGVFGDKPRISSRFYCGREDGAVGSLAARGVTESDWAGVW
jgi:hypothetical protein